MCHSFFEHPYFFLSHLHSNSNRWKHNQIQFRLAEKSSREKNSSKKISDKYNRHLRVAKSFQTGSNKQQPRNRIQGTYSTPNNEQKSEADSCIILRHKRHALGLRQPDVDRAVGFRHRTYVSEVEYYYVFS